MLFHMIVGALFCIVLGGLYLLNTIAAIQHLGFYTAIRKYWAYWIAHALSVLGGAGLLCYGIAPLSLSYASIVIGTVLAIVWKKTYHQDKKTRYRVLATVYALSLCLAFIPWISVGVNGGTADFFRIYASSHDSKNTHECKLCGKEKPNYANGYCYSCYKEIEEAWDDYNNGYYSP